MSKATDYNLKRAEAGAFDDIKHGPIWDALQAKGSDSEIFAEGVALFQRANGQLEIDGMLGPATLTAINEPPEAAQDRPQTGKPDLASAHKREGQRLGLWLGWGRFDNGQWRDLAQAGCNEVILNLNDATKPGWSWSPGRRQILKAAEQAQAHGMNVVLMPWVWCKTDACMIAARHLASLTKDIGQSVNRWELDAEGSWEVTAKYAVRRTGQSMSKVVSNAMTPIMSEKPDNVEMSATVLYFRRPAGDTLLMEYCTTAAIQAYSVWLQTGTAKDAATHLPNFQPGILQKRAVNFYKPVLESSPRLSRLVLGLPMWAQDRSKAPKALRLDVGTAIRRATQASLDMDVFDLQWWAGHLIDGGGKTERRRFDYLLRELNHARSIYHGSQRDRSSD